jgi:predicted nucleic acid-binding Zn ribbon protein
MPHSKGFAYRKDRRSGDPVSIGDVVDRLMEEGAFSRGMPIATLMSRWPELVGERLAGATEPASLDGGVLVVRASDGPWGAQATFLAEAIRAKADDALGGGQVTSVRVVVGGPPGGRSSQENRR